MKSRAGFVIVGLAAVALVVLACGKGRPSGAATITLAGNSVARTVYEKGLIPAFKTAYANAHSGKSVDFIESYDGSGAQQRAIEAGLKADVAALSLSPEIDKLAADGLASKLWSQAPNHGVPATSVVVMVVRSGNPKKILDWGDLTREDVDVVLPNPDTSGAAKWNIAAIHAWFSAQVQASSNVANAHPTSEIETLRKIRSRVKAFGKSGKEAMQIFYSGVGDVTVGWECEALDRKALGDQIDLVYPPTTLEMDPPVAVITPKGQQPNPAAQEFVQFLSSPAAQKIYADNHYRPASAQTPASFPAVANLMKIDQLGGWSVVQKTLFGPEGIWTKAAQ